MKDILLSVRKLKRVFKTDFGEQEILKDISVDIYRGDFTVIMGASGSGKSTFLYCISGMDSATSGEIIFDGVNIPSLSADKLADFRKKHCGFIFQQICLVDSLTVMDNIMVAGLLSGNRKKAIYEKATSLLTQVGIEKHTWDKFPYQISGGKAQRVGIVRAMINSPEVLFADEPTGALNSQVGQDVLDRMTEFNRNGQTTIMVTHDLRSAIRADRVLYLKDGVIVDECRLGKYDGDTQGRIASLTEFLTKLGW